VGSREIVRRAALAAIVAGCGTTAPPPPVLTGSAVPPSPACAAPDAGAACGGAGPEASDWEDRAEATADLRCPLFPAGCLATDGQRPDDCPDPQTPVIVFADNSSAIPRAGRAVIDRVVQDSRRFADATRVIISADSARIEPPDLGIHRALAVKEALVAHGLDAHRRIIMVSTAVYMLDRIPEPPTNRVEIDLRGCR
jgi:hypothetical protein